MSLLDRLELEYQYRVNTGPQTEKAWVTCSKEVGDAEIYSFGHSRYQFRVRAVLRSDWEPYTGDLNGSG